MPLNIEIEVQGCESSDISVTNQCETLTLEIIDASSGGGVPIDDNAGIGDTNVTWSADKSSRELADKVDKVSGYSLVADDEIAKLLTVEQDAQKNTVNSVAGRQGDVLLDKKDVGLSSVDNTSDINKPVSNPAQTALDNKVDKQAGKGLSDTNFTQAEKDKLSSLEGSKFVGLFVSESALPLSGGEGDYANVDGGVGSDVYRVIWDSSDNKWVRAQGVSTELTDAQIKQQYESNPDTNAFTDDEKDKLTGIAVEATKNRDDSENADKVHPHTMAQVTGLDTALAGKASTTDQRLTDAREWSAATVTQLVAESGTSTDRLAFTPQRIRQSGVATVKSMTVQTTGQSTTDLMSQKATTDAIANIPSVPKTAAYTVTAADKGKSIDTVADVTLPASVFAVGDVIVVTNTSATDSSITAASGVTIRLAGSDSSGARTLAGYGVATLRMASNNVWFASGAGLS